MTATDLRELQLERLQWTLRHAYANVPHYTKKFDEHGVTPQDCRSLADLAKFPFTTKSELRDNYPYGMFAVPREKIRRLHASSGTTGTPTVVGYTAADLDNWADLAARSIETAGGKPGDLVHNAYGYGLFTGGLGAHSGAEKLGCTVIPASGGMTARQVQLINDLRPNIIMVTPSYFLTLLDEFTRQGLDPAASSLRVGIFGAEPWTEQLRTEVEQRCALDAVDIYGLSELMGPGMAQESIETKDGLHVWEDHFYPEIIDPIDAHVLADGEPGELVFTSLTKEAMPIIRYRTRDLTRILPPSACPPYRRIEKITGRSDDMIILRGVNIFPTQIEEIVLRTDDLSPHFQLVRSTVDRMDQLTVRVESQHELSAPRRQLAQRTLTRSIKDSIGVSVHVHILAPETLERSLGKLRRVVDER